jgi:hypothetical protein
MHSLEDKKLIVAGREELTNEDLIGVGVQDLWGYVYDYRLRRWPWWWWRSKQRQDRTVGEIG